MISRRRFLQTGALGGIAVSGSLPSRAEDEGRVAIPVSIASLKSMRDQATPISVDERCVRQEKARQLMQANRLDAIVLAEGTSLDYFTGINWWGSERMFAMVLPAKGNGFYVCPAFEEGRAREQMVNAPDAAHSEIRVWQEDESPYERLAQGLRERGLFTGAVGVEESVRFVFSDGISKAAPQVRTVSATPVTAGCRMVKSDHELQLMRLANRATLTAYEAIYRGLKEGMTKVDIEALFAAACDRLSFPGDVNVQIDQNTAAPHGFVAPQAIREGSLIMLDDGCRVEGYISDITRVFTLGKASDKMKRIFDIVLQAQSSALKAALPGRECQVVDAAARKVISDAAYGPGFKYFTHRVGHGIGMDEHEWPYLVRGNKTIVARNMTFSDEPGIYIPGEFGIRLEDDMHITESGAELFTPQSPCLEAPFSTA
jgi:Xaa-Pro dipeptidase